MRPAILITRPEPAATRLAERLAGHGFSVLRCPVLESVPVADPGRARVELAQAWPADWVIFVSPAAVAHGLALLPASGVGKARVVAPGPGTARELQAAGFSSVLTPGSGFTSEALLALPELRDVENHRILICNAPDGRGLLVRALRRRGARVREVYVYRRRIIPPPEGIAEAIVKAPAVVAVITSQTVLAGLRRGLSEAAWQHLLAQRLQVSSERLAGKAREAGFRDIEVIVGADDDSVLSALVA